MCTQGGLGGRRCMLKGEFLVGLLIKIRDQIGTVARPERCQIPQRRPGVCLVLGGIHCPFLRTIRWEAG